MIKENQQHGAFIIRIALGTILLAHSLLKILVFSVAGTVGFFASLGLPAIIAYLTIFAELAGGITLLLGIYSRLTALLTLPILIGATWVHINNGWLFSNQGGGWEFPALLIILAIAIIFQGAGSFAIKKLPIIDKFIPESLKG